MTASSAAAPAPVPAPATAGRKSDGRLLLVGMAILLLALALNGALTLSALRSAYGDTLASQVRVSGTEWALRIEGSIRFGKPISQFFGIGETLREIEGDVPEATVVALVLPDGTPVAAVGAAADGGGPAVWRAALADRPTEPVVREEQGLRHFLFPVEGGDGAVAGALAVVVPEAAVAGLVAPSVDRNVAVLLLTAAGGALLLLVGLRIVRPFSGPRQTSKLKILAVPVVVLLAAQGVYSAFSIDAFGEQYRVAALNTAESVAGRFERDFERLFAKGVRVERLTGLEAPFGRAMAQAPQIAFIELADADGAVLHRVWHDGRSESRPRPVPPSPDLDRMVTLDVPADAGGDDAATVGRLRVHLSPEVLAEGVRQRVLDAATVVLISALFVVEMLVLMQVLIGRASAAAGSGTEDRTARVAAVQVLPRSGAFLLLFAWALPLSFVPLVMRQIATPMWGIPLDVVIALPISAEMLCALVTALIAGGWSDRRGWHQPFFAGVMLTALGGLASGMVDHPALYVAARALVGLGYGLAWMGIQAFVFAWAPPEVRARALSNLVAGIIAGHICGSAVGAMLAQYLGYETVFAMAALAGILPGLYALLFMRDYFRNARAPAPAAMARPVGGRGVPPVAGGGLRRLVTSGDFAWLLLGSVVPFSIAQVGLLYYTLPLYLSDQGVAQSNIGRIMMIYGLSVIYLGPIIGRFVDRSERKKRFIVAGGLIGGGGMAYLYLDGGLAAITLSVFLLGLASSLAGAAQSAYALKLPAVQDFGVGKAMSLQRAADKLGQMGGPLICGALFAATGTANGLAITGLAYLAGAVLFALLAREPSVSRP